MSKYDSSILPQYFKNKIKRNYLKEDITRARKNKNNVYYDSDSDSDIEDDNRINIKSKNKDEINILSIIEDNKKSRWYNEWVNKKMVGSFLVILLISICFSPIKDITQYISSDGNINTSSLIKDLSHLIKKNTNYIYGSKNINNANSLDNKSIKIYEYDPSKDKYVEVKTHLNEKDHILFESKNKKFNNENDNNNKFDIERIITVEDKIINSDNDKDKKYIYIDMEDDDNNSNNNIIKYKKINKNKQKNNKEIIIVDSSNNNNNNNEKDDIGDVIIITSNDKKDNNNDSDKKIIEITIDDDDDGNDNKNSIEIDDDNGDNEIFIENNRIKKINNLLNEYKIKKNKNKLNTYHNHNNNNNKEKIVYADGSSDIYIDATNIDKIKRAKIENKKKNYFVDTSVAFESPAYNELPIEANNKIKCHNNGILRNGKCICPLYFEGKDCSYKLIRGNVFSKREKIMVNTQCAFDHQCLNLYAHPLPNDITPIDYTKYFVHGSYCYPKCINRQCYCQQKINDN